MRLPAASIPGFMSSDAMTLTHDGMSADAPPNHHCHAMQSAFDVHAAAQSLGAMFKTSWHPLFASPPSSGPTARR